MELAIELAREAAAEGEVPVGAVVLDAGGAVIGSGVICARRTPIRWRTPRSRP